MKLLSTIFLLAIISLRSFSQSGQWIWVKGDTIIYAAPVWGTKGVGAPANTPPPKYAYYHWQDTSGNFWVYSGNSSSNGIQGYNDLWKFDLQSQNWIWMHGDNTLSSPPIKGTQGVPASNNTPGAATFSGLSWTDNNGKFWLYGGYYGRDMWKYDPTINEWTWMQGTSSNNPSYGTYQVPSPSNTPGYVQEDNASWVDDQNNLWFYGGQDASNAALWKYDTGINQWAWMSGSNSSPPTNPVYGTLGVPSTSNMPGSRWCYASWKDADGNFMLFGGREGLDYSSVFDRNDLWKYNLTDQTWTWMGGDSAINGQSISGGACSFSTSYIPGARFENSSCAKDSCGNIWMYGGKTGNNYVHPYADLWIYRPQTNDWASHGDTTHNPHFGTKGVPAQNNTPGERMGSITWFDHDGNMWLFGGGRKYPYWNNGVNFWGQDLWKYSPDYACLSSACVCPLPSSSQAAITAGGATTFCSGGNVVLTVATAGFTYQWKNSGSTISGATLQSFTATSPGSYSCDVSNSCGTTGSNSISITVNTAPTTAQATISAGGATTFCSGGNVVLIAATSGFTYQWKNVGSTISGATLQSFTASASGSYTCDVSNSCGTTTSNSITVTVNTAPTAAQATITAGGPTTFCKGQNVVLAVATAGFSYQWKKGNTNISGATLQSYTVNKTATYKCVVSNTCGSVTSNSISVTVNPSPTASVSAAPCSGGAVLLTCSFTPGTGVTLQWTKNNVNISGATNATYSATAKGTYKCLATITATGCTKLSNGAKVTITCKLGDGVSDNKLIVFPNPSPGIFTLEISSSGNLSIEIRNVIGQLIFSSEEKNIDGNLKKQIDLTGQASGIYFLTVRNDERQWVQKILIE